MELAPLDLPTTEEDLLDKRQLIEERRDGMVICAWWLARTNTVSLQLINLGAGTIEEDIIPNDKVLDAVQHPFVYIRGAHNV